MCLSNRKNPSLASTGSVLSNFCLTLMHYKPRRYSKGGRESHQIGWMGCVFYASESHIKKFFLRIVKSLFPFAYKLVKIRNRKHLSLLTTDELRGVVTATVAAVFMHKEDKKEVAPFVTNQRTLCKDSRIESLQRVFYIAY